ncbi:molybdate ABC transporter substrate-binding protein [bacterium]|nr:molybdate ABC transporter substrate-binding protein [bacterium]
MTSGLLAFPDFPGYVFVTMHKVPLVTYILSTFALTVAFSCRPAEEKRPSAPRPITLRVAAASDLQPWLGVALESWGKSQTPAIQVETIYGSSHQLATQIRSGAPVDLFLSADRAAVDSLAEQHLIEPDTVRPYAIGRLAILSRKPLLIKNIRDLKEAEFRHLAIASPETAPYGKAAKSALVASGLWDVLESKIVITASVRLAFQNVSDGNAEAGIVSLGHARSAAAGNPDLVVFEIPQNSYPPIVQYLGVVRSKGNSGSAPHADIDRTVRALAEWITGQECAELFRSHDFRKP